MLGVYDTLCIIYSRVLIVYFYLLAKKGGQQLIAAALNLQLQVGAAPVAIVVAVMVVLRRSLFPPIRELRKRSQHRPRIALALFPHWLLVVAVSIVIGYLDSCAD